MVVREEINGPARTAGGRMDCSVARVHDASHTIDATEASTRKVGVMRALTGGAAEHTMLVFRTSNVSVLRESEDRWHPTRATHDARSSHGSEPVQRRPA